MLTSLLLRFTFFGAEWVLWVLLLLSVASIALAVERCIFFYLQQVDSEDLAVQLESFLKAENFRGAWTLVQDGENIECKVLKAGLSNLRRGATACGEAMAAARATFKPALEARLAILATIGSNAPFVGLLGTVLGIIKAASELTGGADRDPSAVMGAVFESLVATAVGLLVAIPAVVAFNLFQIRVRKTLTQVDALAHLLLAYVRTESRRAAIPTPPATVPPRG